MKDVDRPLNVLHVVESMDNQATESWLRRVHKLVSEMKLPQHWTFFCTHATPGKFEREIIEEGGSIIRAESTIAKPVAFISELRSVIRRGNFDVIDAHHDIMSGFYLWAARRSSIKTRIVHVHNTSLTLPTPSRMKVALTREPLRAYCLQKADHIIGVSKPALAAFVGTSSSTPRDAVVHCGVSDQHFRFDAANRRAIRSQLNISQDALVLLFAGRLIEYKNPLFLIDVAAALRAEGIDAVVLIAGSGPLSSVISEVAAQRNMAESVRLVGWLDDIAPLMHASDTLLAPSLETVPEGLGLGVIEAQAAGLPVIASMSVPEEAVVIPGITRRLELSSGPSSWARHVSALSRRNQERSGYAEAVEASSFGLRRSLLALTSYYAGRFAEGNNNFGSSQ